MDYDSLINKELNKINKYSKMVKGNLCEIKKTCSKENCICHKGEKHITYHLTYKGENNITKTIYIKKEEIKSVKKMLENYKKAKAAFEAIIDLNLKHLKDS